MDCCKCNPKKYKTPPLEIPFNRKKVLDFSEWYDISRKYWLTKGDVMKMKKGETIKVLHLDRNVGDHITINKEGKAYYPQDFFEEHSTMHWTKVKDLFGLEQFDDMEGSAGIYALELYLHDKCMWHPLEYNTIEELLMEKWTDQSTEDKKDNKEQKIVKNKCTKPGQMSIDNCKSWTNYPDDTYVGWRGPFILWENVALLPKIRYRFAKDGYSFL